MLIDRIGIFTFNSRFPILCILLCLVMFHVDAMEASYEPVSSQCGTGLRAKASITGSKLASTESNFISGALVGINTE